MIIFKDADSKYIEEAVTLAMQEYQMECAQCPSLMKEDFSEKLHGMLTYLFSNRFARVAIQEGKVVGYLAFYEPFDGLFGNVRGSWSPLGANAFGGTNRARVASLLFQNISQDMVSDNVCSIALTRYAHDKEVGASFVLNGFGIRCSDAIMSVKDRKIILNTQETVDRYEVVELNGTDKKKIQPLRQQLELHMACAPIFFPTNLDTYDGWFERENIRVFAAKDNDKYIGFISVTDEGETFLTGEDTMYNICGAYVEENYRKKGIAQQILEYICQVCEQEGKTYLGVDCETLNPNALHFWGKYFDNYTYSYARRIDERIVGYDNYFNEHYRK